MKLKIYDLWKLTCGISLMVGYIIYATREPYINLPWMLPFGIGGGGMALILDSISNFVNSGESEQ